MAIRVVNVTAQVLYIPTIQNRTVEQTINFVEEPFRRTVRVANITLQYLGPGEPQIRGFGTQNLGLSQQAIDLLAIADREVPFNVINFTQVANSPNWPQVFDNISFTQTATTNLLQGNPQQVLGLNGKAQGCLGAPWETLVITQDLGLTDLASRGREHTIVQNLTLNQVLDLVQGGVNQNLNLIQVASGGIGSTVNDTIEFTQTLGTESDFLRSVTDANFLKQAFTYYIDTKCNQKSYAKFDGEGEGPGLDTKRLTFTSDFVLETLGSGPKTKLNLRSPETDDIDRLGFNRINRETRGGELNVFGDPIWGKVNSLLFTIVALTKGQDNCPDKITALLDFFQNTLGQEILLHDWTGVSWQGVVTTPNDAAVEDQEGYWTITFEFEGIALPGPTLQQPVSITDAVSRLVDYARPLSQAIPFVQTPFAGGDIRVTATQNMNLVEQMGGTHEVIVMDDDLSAGAASNLDGTSPTTGTDTWTAHVNFKDDGSQSAGVSAGAYYPVTLVEDTVYQLDFNAFNLATASDSDNVIAGFYEGVSISNTDVGDAANGSSDPTTAKAVHLRREVLGGQQNAFRLGSASDGEQTSVLWTDVSLRNSPDAALDLRIIIDTNPDIWTATWQAKSTISSDYTEVGPESGLIAQDIGAVGWSNDSANTDMSCDRITLTELRVV